MFFLWLSLGALIAAAGSESFSPLAQAAQTQCSLLFKQGAFASWRSAMLCGTALSSSPMEQGLRQLGLIHFMVVSGSHLIFLETLLRPLLFFVPPKKRSFPLVMILLSYCLVAGLQPPVVRALAQKNFFRSQSARLAAAGIFSAVFFREFSLSLCLSWAATLLMSWPTSSKKHPCLSALFILAGLYPLIVPLGAAGGFSSFLQPLFSFIFGVFVFPGSLIAVVPAGVGFSDLVWESFFKLLTWIQLFPLGIHQMDLPHFPRFLYVLILQYLYWRAEISVTRKSLWKNR